MFYFNGDIVKLRTGKRAEIIDSWGVARTWYKVKLLDGTTHFVMSDRIESVIQRFSNKRKWGAK